MHYTEVRLGTPYSVTVNLKGGPRKAKFVPTRRQGSTAWGPIFFGEVYLNGGKRAEDEGARSRFFADEMEPIQ